jgi:enterochelin esterase-like enzyme
LITRLNPRVWGGVVVATVLALVVPVTTAGPAKDQPLPAGVTDLTVQESGSTVALHYRSAALAAPTTTVVVLPDAYRRNGPGHPAAYFLHGETDDSTPLAQVANLRLAELGHARSFLTVVPDADDSPACATCVWTDGRLDLGVRAERHLLTEVVPLVEQQFNVLTTRSGRALLGTSMGGTGALIQAFRHPDRFGFVGALSAALDLAGGIPGDAARYTSYLTGQGLRPRGAFEIDWRSTSPLDLAPQAVAANLDTVITVLPGEAALNDPAATRLAELGLPHRLFRHDGARFTSDGETFRRYVLQPMLDRFADPLPRPADFSYKSVESAFDVWDYRFAVTRQNTEFLDVLGARTDGRSLLLAGTGSVAVTTPAAFWPGHIYRVARTPHVRDEDDPEPRDDKVPPLRPVTDQLAADENGRLHVVVDLGPNHVVDEQEALLHDGQTGLRHVGIEITDPNQAPVATDLPAPRCASLMCPPPAAYDGWNVTSTPWSDNEHVLTLSFLSPLISPQLKTENREPRVRAYVHLPDSYFTTDEPLPVLYFLHGTVDGDPVPSGKWQSFNMGFQDLLARQKYVVVSVDVAETSFCPKCWWIDDLDSVVAKVPYWRNFPLTKIKADRHLRDELIPLVESMFRVRTDRAGRGVIGNSMGGAGAVQQAMRHPDLFSFAGGVSPWQLDVATEYNDPGSELISIYFRRQGYPYRSEGEIHYRNVSPSELAGNVLGSALETFVSAGDGCFEPAENVTEQKSHCGRSVELFPVTEKVLRRDERHVSPQWAESGMPHVVDELLGVHYYPDGDVYRSWYLERINAHFARPLVDPVRISHKSAYPHFRAWGYDFAVDRPNVEFLSVLGARLDGRQLGLAGTGTATVTTPQTFTPGRSYRVRATDGAGAVHESTAAADSAGRLRITVNLGPAHGEDERTQLIAAGQWTVPVTTVDVLEPGGGSP